MSKSERKLYEMTVDGERKFVPLYEAAQLYDSGFLPVTIGTLVVEDDGSRPMTGEERSQISELADEIGMNK